MRLHFAARDIPVRLVTGAYIAHSGLEKWRGSPEQAEGLHGMAATAFPFLRPIPPKRFMRILAAGELVTGTVLLDPLVPSGVAGAALSVFSGGLVAMYARTPAMHRPGIGFPPARRPHALAETVARRLRLDQVGRAVEPGGADTEGRRDDGPLEPGRCRARLRAR
jgi:uncharacterized membrane protein YphA (DoxX/SURF4 family)